MLRPWRWLLTRTRSPSSACRTISLLFLWDDRACFCFASWLLDLCAKERKNGKRAVKANEITLRTLASALQGTVKSVILFA